MTLRWRYYLAIVPLLLGLGLASTAVLVHLVRSETGWGMQQRAEGVAASLAEFHPVLEAASAAERERLLDDVLARLGPAAVSVHLWPLRGEAPLWTRSAPGVRLPEVSAAAPPALGETGLAWRLEQGEAEGAAARIVGHALVRGADGNPRALVSVAEEDDSLARSMRALWGELAWAAVLLFAAGCALAEWLTRSVQRELGTLAQAARDLEAGRSASGWAPGRIQEINDLGGTLQTMGSLLADGVQRIRQGFFEAETIPSRQSIAQHVQRRRITALAQRRPPADSAWCALGEPAPEHVLVWQHEEGGWSVALGVVDRLESGDPLESALHAEALARLGLSAVAGSGLDSVHAPACLWVIRRRGDALQVEALGRAGAAPVVEAIGSGGPASTARWLFGTLEPEAMQIARMYVHQTGDRPLPQVIGELEALLGARYSGYLWACEAGTST